LQQHALGVAGGGRADDLDAWRLDELGLDGIGVELGGPDAAAERGPDRHLGVVAAPAAEAVAAELRTDLVEPLVGEAEELDLGNRDQAADREPERAAQDGALRERGVDDALRPEALQQPLRGPEDAAQPAHVEPE